MAAALGDDLRRARRAAGLTQVQLAQVSKLDLATIQNLERGRGTITSLMSALVATNQRFFYQPHGTAFGEWLLNARRARKASQDSLAREAGISRPTLGQLEQGRGNLRSLFCVGAVLGLRFDLRRDDGSGSAVSGQCPVRYGTLCSGIEAVSEAWEPLGFQPVFFAENAPFPSAVLAHRHPTVPNLGDIRNINGERFRGQLDVLWASTPCTSFSMAGGREGLQHDDGALTADFARLCDEIAPSFVVWENVKGVLVDERNAFGHLLAALVGEGVPLEPAGTRWTNAGAVYGPMRAVAWRVFDAQYAGLAQRRERLFLVGCDRDWADPAEILFERGGRRRDRPPVRTAPDDAAGDPRESVVYVNSDARPKIGIEVAHTLKADTGSGGRACIVQGGRIRRITPREAERLMGLPDDYTLVPWRGRLAPDTLRWRAIGNSVAVPDVRWLGERIRHALSQMSEMQDAAGAGRAA